MSMNMPSGRRGGGGGARRTPMAEINVTPLVDVMLVLLIIFMVTAPLLVTGVPIRLPESRAKALDQDQKPTVLSIDQQGVVFLNDEAVPEEQLAERLETLRGSLGPEDQLFLRADSGLDYGQVMRVMGELNRAGIDRVALVTAGPGETTTAIERSSEEP